MLSTNRQRATAWGLLLAFSGALLLVAVWMLSESLMELILASAVAMAIVATGGATLRERQIKRPYADAAVLLVGVSVLFLLV